ncbi:DUF1778 domain-containing protein [Photorhabdus hindustanensis]|uniref:DUF1778 domain-containing protein n=2 Tax=Photorhabdus hindustanensis TaxID=2918802 RepID=A0A2S8PVY1_9GAMM|nr:DUF1778 domain-containing protein [Photorhabdus hindustanensis]
MFIWIKNADEIMATNTERKETRLVARISTEIQEIIQIATEQTETLHLSMKGADALLAALENPPKANSKLLKAAKHYKDRVNVYNP